jgi:hypothetical protein
LYYFFQFPTLSPFFPGYNLSQIGELLGHRDAGTTSRYAHLMDDAAMCVAEDIAGKITGKG